MQKKVKKHPDKPKVKKRHPYILVENERYPGQKVRWIKTVEQERELYQTLGI